MCIHVHWKHSKMSMHQYFIVFPQLLAIQCVWQYGFIWQLNFWFGILIFSLSVSGEVKYANYAQVRLVPQLFASSSSLSLWQTTLGCLPQLVVAMNFATKNAQAAPEACRQRETDSILVTLCQRFYSCKPTRSLGFKAVKLVFAERNRNEVSFLWFCLLVVRVACHIVEPNIMAILRAGLKETQAEQRRACRLKRSATA